MFIYTYAYFLQRFLFIIIRKEVYQDVGQNLQQQSTAQTVPDEQNPDGDKKGWSNNEWNWVFPAEDLDLKS